MSVRGEYSTSLPVRKRPKVDVPNAFQCMFPVTSLDGAVWEQNHNVPECIHVF